MPIRANFRSKLPLLIMVALAVSLLVTLVSTLVSISLYENRPWATIESVSVVHLDVIQYDEILVIMRFHNPTHRDLVVVLERANLQADFSGAFNRTIKTNVTSFRFASSPPSHMIRLDPCSNASAGLVFQGQLGLGSPHGYELIGKVDVVMDVTLNSEHRTLTQAVDWDFAWNSDEKAFVATNPESGAVGENECPLPMFSAVSVMNRERL